MKKSFLSTLLLKENANWKFLLFRAAVTEKLNGTYTLNIKYENKVYNLKYPGVKTILDVKSGFYTLTNVHVRNQIWTGWPPTIDDNTMLALSGIK